MTRHGWLALILVLLFAAPIVAGTLAGITLPDGMDVDGKQLVLNGMALRKKVVFKVYVAGLYLPAKEQSGEKILAADGAALHGHAFSAQRRAANQVNEAWYDGLEANTPGHSAQLKKQFDALAALMEDLKDGDKLVFTYKPGHRDRGQGQGQDKGHPGRQGFRRRPFCLLDRQKAGTGREV